VYPERHLPWPASATAFRYSQEEAGTMLNGNGASRANGTDRMVRATAYDGRVRAFALDATGVVAEMQRRHGTAPGASAALGRTAMGALLFGAASLKEPSQVLSVEIRGDGPLGRILCTATGAGEVRGLVANPGAHAPGTTPGKLNVAGVVGTQGYVSVTKHLGSREPYQGMTELMSGEIGDDLANYLVRSEQIASAVGVGVFVEPDLSVSAAGGYLIQVLGGLVDEEVTAMEDRLARLPHPTALISDGVTPEQVLARIFPGDDYEVLDRYPVRFHCPCTMERFEAAIVSLGADEVTRIIKEEEQPFTEVVCHFCNEAYRFSPAQMQAILEAAR
jgi:molecular chaperone Hsp33